MSVNKRVTFSFFYRFIEFVNVRHFLFITVPTAPPLNVRLTKRSERQLVVSWDKPDTRRWSGKATRYKICHSTQERDLRPTCKETNRLSYEITSLQPFTKYFVTVSAGTSFGFGPKTAEVSEMTNRGMSLVRVRLIVSLEGIGVRIDESRREKLS